MSPYYAKFDLRSWRRAFLNCLPAPFAFFGRVLTHNNHDFHRDLLCLATLLQNISYSQNYCQLGRMRSVCMVRLDSGQAPLFIGASYEYTEWQAGAYCSERRRS
jgi:hypothetical protein